MPKMPIFLLTENANENMCKKQLLEHTRKNGNKW